MRKWMRERLKRRKKADTKAEGAEPGKAPLQPAYFDAAEGAGDHDTAAAAADETAREMDASESPEPEQGNSDIGSSRGTSLPSAEIPHKRSVVAEVAAEEAVVAEGNRTPP